MIVTGSLIADIAGDARLRVVCDYLKLINVIDQERARLVALAEDNAVGTLAYAGHVTQSLGRIVAVRDEIGGGG
jgi:hypothetical protein